MHKRFNNDLPKTNHSSASLYLESIVDMQQAINDTGDNLEQMVSETVTRAEKLVGAAWISVEMVASGKLLWASTGAVPRPGINKRDETTMSVISSGAPALLGPLDKTAVGEGVSYVVLPLTYEGSNVGVLKAQSSAQEFFSVEEQMILKIVANLLVSAAVKTMRIKQSVWDATHDSLAGLFNRSMLSDHLDFAMEQASRYGLKVQVLFLDLDGFKAINDTYGHDAGDRVLIEVAQRISAQVRKSDWVARLGGDEFVVVAYDSQEPFLKIV